MVTKHKSGDDIEYTPFKCSNCPPESYYGTLVRSDIPPVEPPKCENCKRPLVMVAPRSRG